MIAPSSSAPKQRLSRCLAGIGVVALSLVALSATTPAHGTVAAPTKVLTIVEENHSYAQMKSQMVYLYSLAQTYGYATNYYGVSHPSLPNYLAIVGGSTFGIADDKPPSVNAVKVGSAKTIFDLALDQGKTGKTYAETMTTNCQLTTSGKYAVKHNPWAYFAASRTRCNAANAPMTSFLSDAQSNNLPNVGMVVPNLCNDAHDCALSIADGWLKKYLPTVLASTDFTSGRLTVVITADEDDRSAGNNVLTVVLNPALHGKVTTSKLTHYSLCGYYSHVLGASLIGKCTTGFSAAFGLP